MKRYILELLCNIICPTKPEPAYMMVLNKAHTQEEFIRGSMTKNPYSSLEVGPLMRDVRNKICHQLDMVGLIEDDCGMELLVAGNIISLDLSVSQVYEQVWRKSQSHPTGMTPAGTSGSTSLKECPPMAVTYRLQVCTQCFV
jgi:E3 ubiquitin-protein ligase UBR4